MAGIRGGGGVQTNVSLAKKSEVNDSVNSVTSIRLHKRWGVNTLQYSHPLTRPVTHLALSCNALYTWRTYISNYHNNRTLIIGEKKAWKSYSRANIFFILKQFVQEVSRSHYIYRHRDSCGMLLRLQPHGKSKKLMIKAVSLKHDFHIFNGTVKCTIYYHRYFSLQTTDMSSFIIASVCFF